MGPKAPPEHHSLVSRLRSCGNFLFDATNMDRLYEDQNALRAQMNASEQVCLVDNDGQVRNGKRMSGRLQDIAFSFSIVTIPMFLFTGFLLGLVYHYRITHNDVSFETLQVAGTTDEAGIYYVNLSATILIFIAS